MIPKFEAVCLEKAAEAEMVGKKAAEAALEFDEIRFADQVTQDALKQQLSAKAKELEAASAETSKLHAELDTAKDAVTPGQAAVFYDGDVVLAGGWIADPPSST